MADLLVKELQKVNDQLGDTFAKGDFKGYAERFFTEDCCLMMPGSDVMIGTEGAFKGCKAFEKAGHVKVEIKTLEVVPGGDDYITERGSYTFYNKEGEVSDGGKYMTLRRKVNGSWLIKFDIWNFSKP